MCLLLCCLSLSPLDVLAHLATLHDVDDLIVAVVVIVNPLFHSVFLM